MPKGMHMAATHADRSDVDGPSRGALPRPDLMLGRSPRWLPSTFRRWAAERS